MAQLNAQLAPLEPIALVLVPPHSFFVLLPHTIQTQEAPLFPRVLPVLLERTRSLDQRRRLSVSLASQVHSAQADRVNFVLQIHSLLYRAPHRALLAQPAQCPLSTQQPALPLKTATSLATLLRFV